ISVEQGDHHSDTRHPKPYRHILRPVRHEKANDVTLRKALSESPSRILVYAPDERTVRQTFPIGEQGWTVALSYGDLLDHSRQDAIAIFRDRRGQFQCAQPCLRR